MPFFAFAGEPQRDTQQAARMGRLLGVLSQGTDDEVDQKSQTISGSVQEGFKCTTRAE